MDLKDFKVIKNKQRPKVFYQYRKDFGFTKVLITTFDSGETFLLTIDRRSEGSKEYRSSYTQKDVVDVDKAVELAFHYLRSQNIPTMKS